MVADKLVEKLTARNTSLSDLAHPRDQRADRQARKAAVVPISVEEQMEHALQLMRALLYQPEADWTSDGQREAMRAVLTCERDVVAVLATGSGKTMLLILTALLHPEQLVVVTLPLKSLLLDYVRRLHTMGISFQVYDGSSTTLSCTPNLVLIQVEHAASDQWRQALSHLAHPSQQPRLICRIFIDEAHFALTAAEYREVFLKAYGLRVVASQLILLSATVPPHTLTALDEAYMLTFPFHLIRTSTLRPEIQYVIDSPHAADVLPARPPSAATAAQAPRVSALSHKPKPKLSGGLLPPPAVRFATPQATVHERVQELVDVYRPQLHAHDRGLIYVQTKAQGSALAALLDLHFYEGGNTSTDQLRRSAYQAWLQGGPHAFMVCTTAFGTGLDYSHVRVVIIAGASSDASEFIQNMHRAGRDGLHALAWIVPGPTPFSPSARPDPDFKNQQLVNDLLYPPTPAAQRTCVREVLSGFCDGAPLSCSGLSDAYPCTHCQPLPPNMFPPLERERREREPALLLEDTLWRSKKRARAETDSGQPSFDSAHQSSRARIIQLKEDSQMFYSELRPLLQLLAHTCSLCYVNGYQPAHKHNHNSLCPVLQGSPLSTQFPLYKSLLNYNTNYHRNVCFLCHLPMTWRVAHPERDAPRDCVYPKIVYPVIFKALTSSRLYPTIQAAFFLPSPWASPEDGLRWLKQRSSHASTSNVIALFIWFVSELRLVSVLFTLSFPYSSFLQQGLFRCIGFLEIFTLLLLSRVRENIEQATVCCITQHFICPCNLIYFSLTCLQLFTPFTCPAYAILICLFTFTNSSSPVHARSDSALSLLSLPPLVAHFFLFIDSLLPLSVLCLFFFT